MIKLLAIAALCGALASAKTTLKIPEGVPAVVVATVTKSLYPLVPADFPWNTDYWTYNCHETKYGMPTALYTDLTYGQLHDWCNNVCSSVGACPDDLACQGFLDCRQEHINNIWNMRADMMAELANCCMQPNPTSCINGVMSYYYTADGYIGDELMAMRGCCPACP